VRSFPPFRQWSYPSPLSPALPSPQKIPWSAFELQTGGLTEVKTVLTNAIRAAQNFIYIEDQIFFRGNATNSLIWGTSILFPLLVSAAVNRVKVIILGSGNAEDGTAPTVWSASDWLNSALITPAYSAATEGAPSISVNALTGAFVHAKVVIVDDTFAMVGSANFADRSMGSTDVEMSVAMVSPPGTVPVPPASPLSTGSIVQDLRITLWAYHFGFDVENPDSWNAIADTSQSFGLWNTSWSQNPLQPPKPGDKTWKHNSLVQQFPVPITEGGS
jgi:phosphatidylserine/phosphatidylglycerophosphate/cardiolipin synthase-like enzyme